jgi:glycerophosphoryl diester phosphodiesterase
MTTSVQVIAHRGASRAEAENTVAAFSRAASMGADAVELDVRRTRDAVLVVHHNPQLDDGRLILDLDAVDLPPSIAHLDDALNACAGMWVNVEIKNDPTEPDFDSTESIAEQTMEHLFDRGQPERWLISSFRIETVDRCRQLADDRGEAIRTAWLTAIMPTEADDLAELTRRLAERGHSALHPWVKLLRRETIDACHAAGLAVNTWTCDDPERMSELIEWGIDGICTNVPDVALSVLGRGPGG